jgi:hypothetical protein
MSNTNFWLVDEQVTGQMEMGGGDIEPIPSKTQCVAAIDEIKWDNYNDEEYISARWNILQPAEFKNRKIFQKIKVKDVDDKKRQKAVKMLAAIDFNAKGGLMSSGKVPTDTLLQKSLMNKIMVIMVQVWAIKDEATGETKKGNWVSAVSPKSAGTPVNAVRVEHIYIEAEKAQLQNEIYDNTDEAELAF